MVPETLSFDALRVLSPQDLALKIETLKLEAFLKSFLPGQTLVGKVIEPFSPGRAWVDFQGHSGMVEVGRPVSPGQKLTVLVEKTVPQPQLRLIPETAVETPVTERPARSLAPTPQFAHVPAEPNDRVQVRQPPPGLPKGEILMSRENPDPHTPVLQKTVVPQKAPVSQIPVLKAPELEPLGLAPGKTVTVEVVRVEPGPVAVVRLAQQEVPVQLSLTPDIQPGALVRIIPKAHAGGFVLTQAPAAEPDPIAPIPLELLKTLLPARQPLGPVLQKIETGITELARHPEIKLPPELTQRLKESLELFNFKSIENMGESKIEKLLSRMGLQYEARVHEVLSGRITPETRQVLAQDMKGQLQELLEFLQTKMPPAPRPVENQIHALVQQVKGAIQNLDLQQVSWVLAKQEHQPLALQIPIMLGEMEQNLKLFFRREGEPGGAGPGGKNGAYTLVFFLDLSALGALRADVRVQGQRLDLKVNVESEPVLEFISSRLPEFQSRLQEAGFQAKLSATTQPGQARQVPDELAPLLLKDLRQLVDIRT